MIILTVIVGIFVAFVVVTHIGMIIAYAAIASIIVVVRTLEARSFSYRWLAFISAVLEFIITCVCVCRMSSSHVSRPVSGMDFSQANFRHRDEDT